MASSRLTSNAARYAGQARRAFVAQALVAARSAASVGFQAAREAARINSSVDPTAGILSSTDNADGTATVTAAAHTRIYPVEGNLDVPDLAISGPIDLAETPPNATAGFVYYDDPTLADVAPAYQWTTDFRVAQPSAAPGRHYVGPITTAAAGGVATTGGDGPQPPTGTGPFP